MLHKRTKPKENVPRPNVQLESVPAKPLATSTPPLGPLSGCVCVVDVVVDGESNGGEPFKKKLEQLGAVVSSRVDESTVRYRRPRA